MASVARCELRKASLQEPLEDTKKSSLFVQGLACWSRLAPLRGVQISLMIGSIGVLIITYTILGVPYYNYSTLGPKTLF